MARPNFSPGAILAQPSLQDSLSGGPFTNEEPSPRPGFEQEYIFRLVVLDFLTTFCFSNLKIQIEAKQFSKIASQRTRSYNVLINTLRKF